MVDLAVVNRAETFERMREPLAERGISVHHAQVKERTLALSPDSAPFSRDQFDAGFVYPGRMMEGGVADALLDVPWLNGRDAVLTSRNKAGILARLERAGVPVPRSVYVSNPADESAVADAVASLDPPVVLKPNSTTRGIGVAKVPDLDSALGVTDYLNLVHDFRATGDRSYLVQEFVPDARDYRVMVLDGEYVGAVERRLSDADREAGRWKHNVHRGAEATPVDLDPGYRRLAERVADELGVRFLGVDLLVGTEDVLVNETNARPTIDDAAKYEDGFWDRLAEAIRETASA
ncbi:ATP-grasp domain-containing protein [Haloarchaeobius salinus]|uniref:ATP-grasp domain-containing protein n=1 Tax=Haloarchaeobius salinus TaxID=1198298 RepID=UPI00210B6AFE|nr:RimK family alpha-L-glutamate ligase [Haloarchaeobius salinus]